MAEYKGWWTTILTALAGFTLHDVNLFFSTVSYIIACLVGIVTIYYKVKAHAKKDCSGRPGS